MRIIYSGPAAGGKTAKLISQYLKYQDDWQHQGYYLVPNNQQINELENRILEYLPNKVLFAPAIETINSLAEKIFPVKKISEVRKQLLLVEIIRKNNYFQEVSDYLTIYETISDIVSEVRNYSIDLSLLQQEPGSTVAKIIEEYEEQLKQQQLYDMERILINATEIKGNPLRYLILDGFDSFNKLHEKFLESLFARSQDIYIGLTYDKNNPALFKDSLRLRDFLLERGFDEQYSQEVYLPTPIKEISQNFLKFEQEKKVLSVAVGRLTGDNLQLQYELIAKQILEFYKTGEYHWSDFGIILRQINERRYLIKNCFEKFNIPVTVNEGVYLWRVPLLQWLMKLYFFALSGLVKDELLAFLNSAFLNLKYSDFNYLKRVFADYPFSNTYQDIEQYIDNKNIKKILKQLQQTCSKLKSAKTFRQQWRVLNDYCSKNKILKNLKIDLQDIYLRDHARENIKAYSRLKNYFEDLHEELTMVSDLKQSFAYIEHFLTQTIIKIDHHPADRVQVYDAPQARQKRFKVVFIADLIFGIFPLPQVNKSLFDDSQRKQIGLRSYLDRQEKENLIFYQLISCADQFIFFCDYLYSLQGSKLTPSIYLDWLDQKYSLQNKKKKKVSEIFFQLNDLSEQDYRYALVNYFYANYPDYNQESENKDLQLMDDNDLHLLQMLIAKKNDLKKQKMLTDDCYQIFRNKTKQISVTALENFDRCPFSFFCRYILAINPGQEFSIYAFRGSLIHKILELFFKRSDLATLSEDQLRKIITELLDQQLELLKQKYPQDYFNSEKKHLLDKLVFFLINHLDKISSSDLQPAQLEYRLGDDCYSYQGVNIHGKIDRIDDDGKQYQVVDYKTGQIKTSKEKLDQILLYTYILSELIDYAKKSPLNPYYLKFPEGTVKKMEFDKNNVKKQLTEVLEKLQKAEFYNFNLICEQDNYQHCEYRQICSKIERGTFDEI